MYAQQKNFTYIDELPELNDLEQSNYPSHRTGQPLDFSPPTPDKYKKFIRNSMGPAPPQSGMAPYSQPTHHQPPPQEFYSGGDFPPAQ